MKKAYVFPGQGAQFSGMGAELYQNNSLAKELFEQGNEILGFRITDIMFTGSAEELKATNVTQPAIYLHSTILAKCYQTLSEKELEQKSLKAFHADMFAGHSLGEFSALTAAGAVSFEDGLRLVALRAREMQKCCEKVSGTMAAIIGLDDRTIEQICSQTTGIVVPANYNSENQIVISGELDAVHAACEHAKEMGAKKAIILPVGGAFHSPLMEEARLELGKAIAATNIVDTQFPIYQNVTGHAVRDSKEIKENLLTQLTSPVRWSQSIKNMLFDGADYYLEIGPGNVLQGLIKRTLGPNVVAEGLVSL